LLVQHRVQRWWQLLVLLVLQGPLLKLLLHRWQLPLLLWMRTLLLLPLLLLRLLQLRRRRLLQLLLLLLLCQRKLLWLLQRLLLLQWWQQWQGGGLLFFALKAQPHLLWPWPCAHRFSPALTCPAQALALTPPPARQQAGPDACGEGLKASKPLHLPAHSC
jgi:hypothetical protein